jgi:hypothetical protein
MNATARRALPELGRMPPASRSALALLLCLLPPAPAGSASQEGLERLEQAFRAQGVELSLSERWCAFRAEVCVREDLLEYVVVAPFGAAHESLLATGASPTLMQTALLALGAEPGRNAEWVAKDPPPSEEALREGVSPYDVMPPSGTGFRLSVAWGEGEEEYFFQLEDLIQNLRTGRSMRRHDWVYLGSRLVPPREQGGQEVLAAELEGNLVNLSWFRAGHTLLSAALPDAIHQTIWLPNAFLLPPRGTPVLLVFSREPLAALPEALRAVLPRSPWQEEELEEPR